MDGRETPQENAIEGALNERQGTRLMSITVAALPNGVLQDQYNPNVNDGIWLVSPDSPARGEKFRTRLSFAS